VHPRGTMHRNLKRDILMDDPLYKTEARGFCPRWQPHASDAKTHIVEEMNAFLQGLVYPRRRTWRSTPRVAGWGRGKDILTINLISILFARA